MVLTFRMATMADRRGIEQLLEDSGLTTVGVAEHLDGFEVVEDGAYLVGSAGLEIYGSAALLRSVAVAPAYQSRGIAQELVARALHRTAQAGILDVYLLTDSATDYFRKFGFEPIARTAVAPAVRASAEFGPGCCETATVMRKATVQGAKVAVPVKEANG